MSQTLSKTRYLLKVFAPKRNQSRSRLFMTIFWGFGLAAAYGVNTGLNLLLAPAHALILSATASLIILPSSLILGMKMWDIFLTHEIRTGYPLFYLRYLEEEFQRDIDRIKNLPLSAEEKAERVLAREDRFNREREPLRRELLKDNRFANSTVKQSRAGFDPRGGTFDILAKLKSKSEGCSVVLYHLGENEDAIIKALIAVNGLAYQEAREVLSDLPAVIRGSAPPHEARAIFDALTAAGASVNVIGPAGN